MNKKMVSLVNNYLKISSNYKIIFTIYCMKYENECVTFYDL